MNEMSYLKFKEVCRVCLGKKGVDLGCFSNDGPLANKFQELTSIKIFETDGLPQTICNLCSDEINKWYSFKLRALKNDEFLRRILREQHNLKIIKDEEDATMYSTENPVYCVANIRKFPPGEVAPNYDELSSKAQGPDMDVVDGTSSNNYSSESNMNETEIGNAASPMCAESNSQDSDEDMPKQSPRLIRCRRSFSCEVCSKSFRLETTLVRHMDSHKVIPEHKCSSCQMPFATSDELDSHVEDSHPPEETVQQAHNNVISSSLTTDIAEHDHFENNIEIKQPSDRKSDTFTCHICKAVFTSNLRLNRHIRRHTDEPQFECPHCDRRFHEKYELVKHSRKHTDERPFTCQVCTRAFKTKTHLKNHLNFHKLKLPHECSCCYMLFATLDELDVHSQNCQPPEEIVQPPDDDDQVQCHICSKTLKRKASLKRHLQIHESVKSYICNVCDKAFREACLLRRHIRSVHDNEKRFHCNDCDLKFFTKARLVLHTRTHTGETPYACTMCPKAFKVRTNLKNHLRTHTGEDRDLKFKCDFCEQMFAIPYDLRVHLRKHTGEKPFQCEVCGESFMTSALIYRHKRLGHARIAKKREHRTNRCDVCGKTFRHANYLETHHRIHTGEKRHVCVICGMAFTSYTTLWAHKYTHSDIKRHICESCGKSFTSPSMLREHKRTHTGEKPFKCKFCDKAFVKNSLLKKHVLKAHPEHSDIFRKPEDDIF